VVLPDPLGPIKQGRVRHKDAPGRWAVRHRKLDAPYRLLSALGAFCLWEFRVFSTNLNILRFICSVHRYPAQRAGDTFCPRSDRFWLLELRVSRTGTKPLRGGKDEGPARGRWTSATHATHTLFSLLCRKTDGGKVEIRRVLHDGMDLTRHSPVSIGPLTGTRAVWVE